MVGDLVVDPLDNLLCLFLGVLAFLRSNDVSPRHFRLLVFVVDGDDSHVIDERMVYQFALELGRGDLEALVLD